MPVGVGQPALAPAPWTNCRSARWRSRASPWVCRPCGQKCPCGLLSWHAAGSTRAPLLQPRMNHALRAGLDRGPRIRQRRRSTLLARAGECAACVTAKIAGELYDVMRSRPDFTMNAREFQAGLSVRCRQCQAVRLALGVVFYCSGTFASHRRGLTAAVDAAWPLVHSGVVSDHQHEGIARRTVTVGAGRASSGPW